MSRVLIVEDDRAIALGLRLNLRKDGHEVEIAHDGEEGLKRGLEPGVELIVLDVMLPVATASSCSRSSGAAAAPPRC